MRRDALFIARRRPLHIEESVPLFKEHANLQGQTPSSVRQSTPDPQPTSPLYADRRGRLSLLCGILLYRKNHSNQLLLGTPPLWGGWVGSPSEGVCPYFIASPSSSSPNGEGSKYYYQQIKRAFLRCEETPFSLQGNALFLLTKASPYSYSSYSS